MDLSKVKWYKEKDGLIAGTLCGHTDGEYTLLPGRISKNWIRTSDLWKTRELAEKAEEAKFSDEEQI